MCLGHGQLPLPFFAAFFSSTVLPFLPPHVRAYEAALNGRDYGGAYSQFEHVWLAK